MPALVYSSSDFPFVPFTKIFSADVNECFTDISTLLNTTKLDDTNIQTHGITRNGSSSKLKTGTANYVLINDSSGNMSEESLLATSRGGTGLAIVPASQQPGDVLQVNSTSTSLTLGAPIAVPATSRLFNFYNIS